MASILLLLAQAYIDIDSRGESQPGNDHGDHVQWNDLCALLA
jgi:hypothetical protein